MLYLLKKSKNNKLKLASFANRIKRKMEVVEEWATTLESEGVVELKYPFRGSPFIRFKVRGDKIEKKKEKEGKKGKAKEKGRKKGKKGKSSKA